MQNKKNIFLKGIANLRAIGKTEQFSLKSSIKIFLFYVYICAVAKPQKIDGNIFFINGCSEAKRDSPTGEKYNRIYIRKFSSNTNILSKMPSLVALISIKDRITTILKSLISTPKGGHYLGRWLEYQLLSVMLEKHNIKKVSSFGHYDEFTYWLTEICKERSIYYTMYQHGIVMDSITVPNKINCDEIHVYNKYSEKIFRNRIIKKSTCKYIVDGFKSNINFKKISKEKGMNYIGIVDQTFPEWLNFVVRSILEINNFIPVVMLHPLSQENILGRGNNIIETRDKYDNLDCIISDFSTLILDYVSIGYSGPIVCTNKGACEGIFGEYNLHYISKEDLKAKIPRLLRTDKRTY